MIRDELNDIEAALLNGILNAIFEQGNDDDKRSAVGMFTSQAKFNLSDIEQEHNTWSTLERIHGGDVMAVVDAIIEGNWIRKGVIHVPYWGKYFACGYAGHKTEIDMKSEFQVTVDYVSRIRQRRRLLENEKSKARWQARLERLKKRK
tara:strand:- start:215 stop:658 length:444 start_codon:yes stop_codon:yes gene_type:complete